MLRCSGVEETGRQVMMVFCEGEDRQVVLLLQGKGKTGRQAGREAGREVIQVEVKAMRWDESSLVTSP